MVTQSQAERKSRHTGFQIVTALYSIVFVASITFGYFLLFRNNPFLTIFAFVLGPLAWFLARTIGSVDNGIRTHTPLFVALLLISSVGIFNMLLLNLEGRSVFRETVVSSQDRFRSLEAAAEKQLKAEGIEDRVKKIQDLEQGLFSEIKNPANCGQGPVAGRILSALVEELTHFTKLSNPHLDCSQNDKIINDYQARINTLIDRAPWNSPGLNSVVADATSANEQLETMKSAISTGTPIAMLRDVKPQLERLDSRYHNDLELLSRQGVDVHQFRPSLDLTSVDSLGEWSQLINIIISRVGKPTTWLYLALAGFADWMMVYLFSLVRHYRQPSRETLPGAALGRAW